MEIEFHGDCKDKCQPGTHKVYRYPDTSAAEHDAFVNAPSLGKHFSQFFRGRKFEKVAAEPLISEQWFSGR